ncbi:cation:proton antiporter [Mycolicibacterium cosmeticum]|uniref:cation:proton antiporter domain-containing protein n=1 Tax=Mycolicibacterium cosmeticum TaxID=258533 RepID=UPI0032048607
MWSVVGVSATLALWALFARQLDRWRITPAMVLVIVGAAVGVGTHHALAASLDTDVILPIIELILAILLFGHATHVRGGFFGGMAGPAFRLIVIALPLSLALSVLLGSWLLPGLSWAALLAVACVVVPIDFAPVASFLHDERIPARVRHLLNVEEGYSDGVVAPILVFALAITGGEHAGAESVMHAVRDAVPHLLGAIVLGLVIGAAVAVAANAADRRGLMTDRSRRLILVCTPVLAYTLNVASHGNGFVAAFVCGIAFNGLRRYSDERRELELLDDIAFLLSAVLWFVFGAVAWYVLEEGVSVGLVVFCVLVVTVVRFVPVVLSLTGSGLSRPNRRLVAVLAPRGAATIVLGLLAFNVLDDAAERAVLLCTILVVLGSVLLWGVLGPVLVGRHRANE